MMWWKSSLVMKCLFSLYFLARKSVGKGSVPQNIYKHQMMLTAFIHILVSIVKVMYLKCIFVKVLLFLFTLSEVFQHQLTEVRKINETIPRTLDIVNIIHLSLRRYYLGCMLPHLAIWFGMSTISCSVGFSPSIIKALLRSCNSYIEVVIVIPI